MLNLLGQDKPREKLVTQGAHYLTDSELLAIFYRVGIKNKSALVLAAEHLTTQGSLQALVDLSYEQVQVAPVAADSRRPDQASAIPVTLEDANLRCGLTFILR